MELRESQFPASISILRVHDVLLPGGIIKIPISSITKKSLDLLGSKVIGIVPCEESESKCPLREGDIGTVGVVLSVTTANFVSLPSHIIIFGQKRFIVKQVLTSEPNLSARISIHEDSKEISADAMALLNKLKRFIFPMGARNPTFTSWYASLLKKGVDKLPVSVLFDVIFSLNITTFEERLMILKTLDLSERINKGMPILLASLGFPNGDDVRSVLKLIPPSVTSIRIFRSGPGGLKDVKDIPEYEDKDITELHKKLQEANLPEYATKAVMNDFSRLKRISPHNPDHTVLRSYLEFVADLPWAVSSVDTLDVTKAKEELDREHYGMKKLKKRVLEYLAVCQLREGLKGPILCFVGPPGVGKTSIGRVIAHVLNRNFQRVSLGGVSHQSEIRGHRRTYIGALPGRILLALKQAGTNNPVILLDEIDKLGSNMMGNPQHALLEVLDPEQNAHFTDHYLGLPFDLSKVTFIATANSLKGIPAALLDRMELIEVPGYTREEKFHIAVRHLIPKQLTAHGLKSTDLQFTDEAVHGIIAEYTREAGVRSLERKVAAVCRSAALRIANSNIESFPIIIDKEDLEDVIGVGMYVEEEPVDSQRVGVALGLSWSEVGGSVLVVEASRTAGGNGRLTLTGRLGDVIKESAKIALTWIRSVQHQYCLLEEGCDLLADCDLHLHFPAGAISKDGPSAGITIACALLSLFTGVPLAPRLAMTGELTLRGTVLPVGGLSEKLSAAKRFGIKKVLVPLKCKKSLKDIPESILGGLDIVLVENMADVIDAAFDGLLTAHRNTDSLLVSKL